MQKSGAVAWGCTVACQVDPEAVARYDRWLADGKQGEMAYLERYGEVREDPRLLLDGAQTIIAAAFGYDLRPQFAKDALRIAAYALGDDYHEVIRGRLATVASQLDPAGEAAWRVCVDTAPLRERYWAAKAGVGRIGRNGLLIVDKGGTGSACLLGIILTTLSLTPDEPDRRSCMECDACVRRCPAGAIDSSGGLDAHKCLSYLTIEYRGELPAAAPLGDRVYGCDICQLVCPHNRPASRNRPPLPEFTPRQALLSLTTEEIAAMTASDFSTLMRHSAIKRTKLSGLQRNAAFIATHYQPNDCHDKI